MKQVIPMNFFRLSKSQQLGKKKEYIYTFWYFDCVFYDNNTVGYERMTNMD